MRIIKNIIKKVPKVRRILDEREQLRSENVHLREHIDRLNFQIEREVPVNLRFTNSKYKDGKGSLLLTP